MPTKTSQYSEAVDAHIYLKPFQGGCYPWEHGCQTPSDWIELALAALDQAGMKVKDVEHIAQIIESKNVPLNFPTA